jgi:hypothetical protein
MSKQLYEEALADVKQLKQIAEDNAKREIIEAVTPRIRELIENQLLNEGSDDDHDYDGKLLIDQGADLEGKEDSVVAVSDAPSEEEPHSELNVEPGELDDEQEVYATLDDLLELSSLQAESVELAIHRTYDEIAHKIKTDQLKSSNLSDLKLKVESLYDSLQKLDVNGSKVESLGEKLEECFAVLEFANGATENNMKKKLNEGDVTLVLHNMPDDLNLDDVTVDLVAKAEEEGGEEAPEAEEGGEEAEAEEGGEEAAPESEEGGEEKKETAMEGKDMEFDPIVEIDEKELREAIKSMRTLSESAEEKEEEDLDEYALAEDEEGEDDLLEIAADDDVEEKACAKCEGKGCDECGMVEGYDDEDDDDLVELKPHMTDEVKAEDGEEEVEEKKHMGAEDDEEELEELGLKRSLSRVGTPEQPNVQADVMEAKKVGAKPKHHAMGAAKLKNPLGTAAKEDKDKNWIMSKGKKVPAGKTVEKQKVKAGKAPTVPGSVSMKPVKESSDNGATEIDSLRAQLAETNLFNAKLLYTNKLLQNEALSARQKAQIIEQLDEASSLREVKLVYESLQKTLATKAPVRESVDRVVGTSSRPTSSGGTSSVLSESVEASRWARLAGIK